MSDIPSINHAQISSGRASLSGPKSKDPQVDRGIATHSRLGAIIAKIFGSGTIKVIIDDKVCRLNKNSAKKFVYGFVKNAPKDLEDSDLIKAVQEKFNELFAKYSIKNPLEDQSSPVVTNKDQKKEAVAEVPIDIKTRHVALLKDSDAHHKEHDTMMNEAGALLGEEYATREKGEDLPAMTTLDDIKKHHDLLTKEHDANMKKYEALLDEDEAPHKENDAIIEVSDVKIQQTEQKDELDPAVEKDNQLVNDINSKQIFLNDLKDLDMDNLREIERFLKERGSDLSFLGIRDLPGKAMIYYLGFCPNVKALSVGFSPQFKGSEEAEIGQAIAVRASVWTSLSLNFFWNISDVLKEISKESFPNLERLELPYHLKPKDATILTQMSLPKLKWLNLHGNDEKIFNTIVTASNFPQLETLDLSLNFRKVPHLDSLKLENFPNLTKIILPKLGKTDIDAIAAISSFIDDLKGKDPSFNEIPSESPLEQVRILEKNKLLTP